MNQDLGTLRSRNHSSRTSSSSTALCHGGARGRSTTSSPHHRVCALIKVPLKVMCETKWSGHHTADNAFEPYISLGTVAAEASRTLQTITSSGCVRRTVDDCCMAAGLDVVSLSTNQRGHGAYQHTASKHASCAVGRITALSIVDGNRIATLTVFMCRTAKWPQSTRKAGELTQAKLRTVYRTRPPTMLVPRGTYVGHAHWLRAKTDSCCAVYLPSSTRLRWSVAPTCAQRKRPQQSASPVAVEGP